MLKFSTDTDGVELTSESCSLQVLKKENSPNG